MTAETTTPRRWARRIAKWTGVTVAVILIAPLLFVGLVVLRIWLGQPNLDGEIRLASAPGAATIARDADGVVHIEAETEAAAYFALGYAHAQDRFFQMEALRRIAAGRLSEIIGPPGLSIDFRMRRLGVARLAKTDVAVLSEGARAIYEAYADGVNAWIDDPSGVAADELALLFAPAPEPWLPEHSLAWNRLMSLRLVSNWGSELMRLDLKDQLTPAQLADLWPDYPAEAPVTVPNVPQEALAAAAAFAGLANKDDGSNAWGIASTASASGGAILANDPHLGLTNPGVWHLVRLEAPSLSLAGASAPGVPAVVLGHNGTVAWGLTNATTDTSDVYVETPAPGAPGSYLTPEGPRPFDTREEVIRIRFSGERRLTLRATRHGPVISDGIDGPAASGPVLALAHTGLLEDEGSAETLYRMNRARSWPDILAALKLTKGPQQNVFYVGPDGAGMATGGYLPVRRNGDGYMPADGASGDGDWVAFADVSAMPQVFEPATGWVANANNALAGPDYPLWLGREWGYGGRIEELAERLRQARPFDVEGMARLQLDDHSPISARLLPLMTAAVESVELSAPAANALERLKAWDRRTGMASAEPLIFYAWMREAVRRIFADELGPKFGGWFRLRPEPMEQALTHKPEWCDAVDTSGKETCGAALAAALDDALAWIAERYGDDPNAWRWGDAHEARFRHLAFGFAPGLKQLFDIRIPAPGGQETINRAAFYFSDEAEPFVQRHGPTLRAVYDASDLAASRFMTGPGQSGRWFSRNRSSLLERWRDGETISLAPLAAPAHVLTIAPGAEQ